MDWCKTSTDLVVDRWFARAWAVCGATQSAAATVSVHAAAYRSAKVTSWAVETMPAD